MVAWVEIPASKSLFGEFNAAFPERDQASDGKVGDLAHALESSDHNPDETGRTPYEDADSINEVHAADIDDDLRKSGWSMQRVLDIIVARCRSGQEKRLQNVIYNRRIISRSWGWDQWHPYDGASAHTEHAHFSFRYGSGSGTTNLENITSPWGFLAAVEEDEMPTADEIIDRMGERMKASAAGDTFVAYMKAIAWQYNGGGIEGAVGTLDLLNDARNIREVVLPPVTATLGEVETQVDALDSKVDALDVDIASMGSKLDGLDAKLDQVIAALPPSQ